MTGGIGLKIGTTLPTWYDCTVLSWRRQSASQSAADIEGPVAQPASDAATTTLTDKRVMRPLVGQCAPPVQRVRPLVVEHGRPQPEGRIAAAALPGVARRTSRHASATRRPRGFTGAVMVRGAKGLDRRDGHGHRLPAATAQVLEEDRADALPPSAMISDLVPHIDTLVKLEPWELAGVLLEVWHRHTQENGSRPQSYNYLVRTDYLRGYPESRRDEAAQVLGEGWTWLVREGIIAPAHGHSGADWYLLTRRGRAFRSRADLDAFRRASALPAHLLHSSIAADAQASFLRGKYATAVFDAFREVEITVRAAGKFPDGLIGVPLMRKAFAKDGPLSDPNAEEGERDAMSALFAGAIGLFKNPHSHRRVDLDAAEATELLILASHLLAIVHSRRS